VEQGVCAAREPGTRPGRTTKEDLVSLPEVVSGDEWRAARVELLAKEKALTRARDKLNADRRRLPMVRVDKDYVFTTPSGKARLLDIFEGRPQLVVYHFMWLDETDMGCRSCSAFVDQIGHLSHLNARGTTFAAVSRGRIESIEKFKARMGWTFPWYSSHGSDFNYDFHVTLDSSLKPIEYNYRTLAELTEGGFDLSGWQQPFDLHGLSVFLRDGDEVFHTYSTYGRGTDSLGFISTFLDLTPLGRQEDWEEPKERRTGRGAGAGDPGLRYHDEYES
jgi:predicted dithiol-disulfide oxidoreductase (DUF899 family)